MITENDSLYKEKNKNVMLEAVKLNLQNRLTKFNGSRKEIADLSANISPNSNEAKIKELHKSLHQANDDKPLLSLVKYYILSLCHF